jgi:hypothetical protein
MRRTGTKDICPYTWFDDGIVACSGSTQQEAIRRAIVAHQYLHICADTPIIETTGPLAHYMIHSQHDDTKIFQHKEIGTIPFPALFIMLGTR